MFKGSDGKDEVQFVLTLCTLYKYILFINYINQNRITKLVTIPSPIHNILYVFVAVDQYTSLTEDLWTKELNF